MPAVLAVLLADLVASDGGHHRGGRHGRHGRGGRRSGRGRGGRSGFGRQGRQDNAVEDEVVPGGVDFSDCEMQDDGIVNFVKCFVRFVLKIPLTHNKQSGSRNSQ